MPPSGRQNESEAAEEYPKNFRHASGTSREIQPPIFSAQGFGAAQSAPLTKGTQLVVAGVDMLKPVLLAELGIGEG
jgi:hypothetical protein